MSPLFKNFLTCLVVLTMGVIQVFGMEAGYLCKCTGQKSDYKTCEPVLCHPAETHETGCGGESEASDCGNENGQDGNESIPSDRDQNHSHNEVRETLLVTALPAAPLLPAVVFYDIPPAFQMPALTALNTPVLEEIPPAPPDCGSPPMPLLVARTIVMLV